MKKINQSKNQFTYNFRSLKNILHATLEVISL